MLVDAFTKYCLLYSPKSIIASETNKQFQKFISYFGIPGKIIMDDWSNFKNILSILALGAYSITMLHLTSIVGMDK